MDITQKAKHYAEGKTMDAITAAIEQAYAEGFADGYKEAKIRLEANKTEFSDLEVEYVDLGLPSGTLWSKGYARQNASLLSLPYMNAERLNIPTEQQFKELFLNCHISMSSNVNKSIRFTGITGKYIEILCFEPEGITNFIGQGWSSRYWLKDTDDTKEKNHAWITHRSTGWRPEVKKLFMGISLPIMLVR